ncbi:hypothetical protein FKP32DRAFT_1598944 [Trametes sanguinea]|nr:hypothetical protein FKP32DRAFT_1598944 [Trametes sanguinea]
MLTNPELVCSSWSSAIPPYPFGSPVFYYPPLTHRPPLPIHVCLPSLPRKSSAVVICFSPVTPHSSPSHHHHFAIIRWHKGAFSRTSVRRWCDGVSFPHMG